MSDIMRPMPFAHLMNWILSEYRAQGSVFGVSKLVRHADGKSLPIFEEKIESPLRPRRPAPHTQLAQNIIAAYAAGSRFFEVKTVQVMDGRGAVQVRQQALHHRRGRVLQLRVVHRAIRPPGLRRVRQGVVRLQAAGEGAGAGRSRRLCVQHERGLRSQGHPEPQGGRLHRGDEGRLRHRGVAGVHGLDPGQSGPV